MAKYRKVDPRIWNDRKFRGLSDNGKLVLFFLLTHPHMTAVGAMRATLQGLAAELGWSAKGFREAFQEVCAKGIAMHDERASFVWLPKFLRYNPPESPNVVKAWGSALEMLPECELLSELIQEVEAFLKDKPEAFAKALPEAFAKAMPNPEPEPEPEPEQGVTPPVAPPSGGPSKRADKGGRGSNRGTRLPTDWTLPDDWRQWAEANTPGIDVEREAAKFADHWRAKSGAGAAKKDWRATWRNWCRTAEERQGKKPAGANSDWLRGAL